MLDSEFFPKKGHNLSVPSLDPHSFKCGFEGTPLKGWSLFPHPFDLDWLCNLLCAAKVTLYLHICALHTADLSQIPALLPCEQAWTGLLEDRRPHETETSYSGGGPAGPATVQPTSGNGRCVREFLQTRKTAQLSLAYISNSETYKVKK